MPLTDITLAATLSGHQNPIFTVEYGYFPNTVFTAGNDKGVVEWDLEKNVFKRILCAVSSSVYALCLIPNTSTLVIALREGKLLFVDVEAQKLLASLQLSKKAIFTLFAIPDRNELLAVGEEGKLFVVSLVDYKKIDEVSVSSTTLRTVAFDALSGVVAVGDKNGWVSILDGENRQILKQRQLHDMPITALAFREGKLLSGGRDARMVVSDGKDLNNEISFVPHMFTVYGIYPHPLLPILATVSRDKSLKFWSDTDYRLLKTISREKLIDGHHLSVNAGTWSKDGQYFISVGDDKLVKVWRLIDDPK